MSGASNGSTFRGVLKVKGRPDTWKVRISVGRVRKNLGFFHDEKEAAKAYDRAAVKHHTRPVLNFRSDGSLNPDRKMHVAGVEVSQGRAKTSRYRGVKWRPRDHVWRACISYYGSMKHLGIFVDEDDAARAVDAAAYMCNSAIRLHKLDRPLNFPDEHDAAVPTALHCQPEEDDQMQDSDDDFTIDDEGSEWDDVDAEDPKDGEVECKKPHPKDGDFDVGAQAEQQQLVNRSAPAPENQPLNKRLRRSAASPSASRPPSKINTSASTASVAAASAARSTPSAPFVTPAQVFDMKQPAVDSVPVRTPRNGGTNSSTAILKLATDDDDDDDQLCMVISAPASKHYGPAVKLPSVQCDAADAAAAGPSSAVHSGETPLKQLRAVVFSARIDISGADEEKLSKACVLLYQSNVSEQVKDFAENVFNNPFSNVDTSSTTERRRIVNMFLETISAICV